MAETYYLDYTGLSLYDQSIKDWGTEKNEEIKIKQTNGKSDEGTILVTPGGTVPATYYTAEEAQAYNTGHNLKPGDEGYKKEGDIKTGAITTNTNIEVNIDKETLVQDPTTKKIKVASAALTQYIGDKDSQNNYAINISSPDANNNKKVSLDINSESNAIQKTTTGVKVKLEIHPFSNPEQFGTNVKEAYALTANDVVLTGTNNEQVIKIYKDSALLDMKLLHATATAKPTYTKQGGWVDIAEGQRTEANLALCFAYENVEGTIIVEAIQVGDFLRENEFKAGLKVENGEVSVKIDSTSESFLTVSNNGVKLAGVQDAINEAAADAKTTITEVAADNPIPTGGAAKILVTKSVQADGHFNYVISGQDLASATALAAEVLRAKTAETAIDTAVGLTKAANSEARTWTPTTNYNAGNNHTVANNMQAIDTKLKAVSDKLDDFTPISAEQIASLFE